MAFLLPILILIPLINGAALLWTSGSKRETTEVSTGWPFMTAGVTLAAAVLLMYQVWVGAVTPSADQVINPTIVYAPQWFQIQLGSLAPLKMSLGADGIGASLVLLTTLVTLSVLMFASLTVRKNFSAYAGWTLLAEAGLLLVFLAMDLLSFYVGFECVLIPLFALIVLWGNDNPLAAAKRFILYTLAGSLPMMVALIAIIVKYKMPDGSFTILLTDLSANALAAIPNETAASQAGIFALLVLGLGIKMALLPLHTWLPATYKSSHSTTSALLAAVVLKMGLFGFLRLALPLTPLACLEYGPSVIAGLGALAIVYGGVAAFAQKDLRILLAYSSLSHVGFITLALFALTSVGFLGGSLQMFNHGVTTAAMFLLITSFAARRGTFQLDQGPLGLASQYPLLSVTLVFFVMAGIGMPMLNNFVGEYLALAAIYEKSSQFAVIGAFGIIIGACYSLNLVKILLFGTQNEESAGANPDVTLTGDMTTREALPMVVLAVVSLFIGVFPQTATTHLRADVEGLTNVYKRIEGNAALAADEREADGNLAYSATESPLASKVMQ